MQRGQQVRPHAQRNHVGCPERSRALPKPSPSPPRARAHATTRSTEEQQLLYKHLGGNTFLLKYSNGQCILVDPWLTGSITFGSGIAKALYTGTKAQTGSISDIVQNARLIVLTQSLPDHAHPPTLREIASIKPDIPIVASPAAASFAETFGFEQIFSVPPNQRISLSEPSASLIATEGALVGPPWSTRENGFVIEISGKRVFYEPHADSRSASLSTVGKVDAMITPLKKVTLGGFPLVFGHEPLSRLVQLLDPERVIALVNSDVESQGLISSLISSSGSSEVFQQAVRSVKQSCEVRVPAVGTPSEV